MGPGLVSTRVAYGPGPVGFIFIKVLVPLFSGTQCARGCGASVILVVDRALPLLAARAQMRRRLVRHVAVCRPAQIVDESPVDPVDDPGLNRLSVRLQMRRQSAQLPARLRAEGVQDGGMQRRALDAHRRVLEGHLG